MLKQDDIFIGQKLFIKPFKQCLYENFVKTIDKTISKRHWSFNNVLHNPGMSNEMTKYFGKNHTVSEKYAYKHYVGFEETPGWVWPIEVLTTNITFKKLKIL